jgi:manganese peroxidase
VRPDVGVVQQLKKYDVDMADLIQMGAPVATVNCPLGPRIRSYVGRKDSAAPAPQLLPSPFNSADTPLSLFDNKTIGAADLVALVGTHSTSQQFFVDTSPSGDPQDSMPGVWEMKFYGQMTSSSAPKRVFKFQNDINLSQEPRTSATWQGCSRVVTG